MEFKDVPISDLIQKEFKNPVEVNSYKNGMMGKVGKAILRVDGKNIVADIEIDNNKTAGNFDIQLFLAGDKIISVLLVS